MKREMFKSKIQNAVVTETELFYEGSITIDEKLLKAADLLPNEKVQVVNLNNGERFETYTIKGEAESGTICLNGPAARLAQRGDRIIVISYALMTDEEARVHTPLVVQVDDENRIKSTENK